MAKIDQSQNNIGIRDVSEGIVQAVDTGIIPPNSVYFANNLRFDEILGRATVRPGTTLMNAQVQDGKSCLGLYQFRKAGATREELCVFNNSGDTQAVLKYNAAGTWTNAITNLTASLKCHFETYLGTVLLVNGAQNRTSVDGITWVSTGGNLDVGNMPLFKYVREFKDRIYGAGVSATPDRLLFSSLPVAGAISWTSGNGFIDVEPEDRGGGIMGLAKTPGYILIFKESSMKRWDGQSTFPESMINVGVPSQEAIVEARQTVFFFSPKGIYETNGGYPRKVSRRVQDIIEAIPSSYYSSVSGICDDDYVMFSIGNITIDGLALTNCVLVYHLDNQHWTMFSFPSQFKMWTMMKDTSNLDVILGGDDDGNVIKVLQGLGDYQSSSGNTIDIPWTLQTQEKEFGIRGLIKEFTKLIVYSSNIRGGELYGRADGVERFDILDKFAAPVGEVKKEYKARFMEYRIQGVGRTGQIIGIDFPDVNVTANYNE